MLLREAVPGAAAGAPLPEFREHLRLGFGFADEGAEDAVLARCLAVAGQAVEGRTGQALIARAFVLQARGWDRHGWLALPVGPAAAVDVVRFVRRDGSVALDPDQWALEPGSARQRLTGPGGGALPPVPTGAIVELEFTAGHAADWSGVPADLRQAVLMLAAHYHENRHGDAAPGMPPSVAALLAGRRPARL